MKVVTPGMVFYDAASTAFIVRGWTFDFEGECYPDPAAVGMAMVNCALNWLAASFVPGANPPPDQRVPLDVERMTQDAIAVARWNPNA